MSSKECVILFDLDGTLIDSTKAIVSSFNDSFRYFGKSLPDKDIICNLIGHTLEDMYISLGVDENRVDEFVKIYKSFYRKRSKQMTTLLPNAREAIIEASKFARLGIVTTKTARYSIELLEYMGLMEYFEVLVGREDVANPKPHPEPIEKALKLMNVKEKKSVWMIGDTCLDLKCAKSAKVRSIGVLCGYGKEEELNICKDQLLQNETLLAIKYIKNCNKADIK